MLGSAPANRASKVMLAGELYDPLDGELVQARNHARDLCQDLNATRERDEEARRRILMALFGPDAGNVGPAESFS